MCWFIHCLDINYLTSLTHFSGAPKLSPWLCQIKTGCTQQDSTTKWLHNNTLVTEANQAFVGIEWILSTLHINQTGTYTCQGYRNEVSCGNVSINLYIIGNYHNISIISVILY